MLSRYIYLSTRLSSWPASASQMLTWQSLLPVITRLQSALSSTQVTQPLQIGRCVDTVDTVGTVDTVDTVDISTYPRTCDRSSGGGRRWPPPCRCRTR